MDRGAEVYFVWENARNGLEIFRALEACNAQDPLIHRSETWGWKHPRIGGFAVYWFRDPEVNSHQIGIHFYDCDLLPEYNDDDPERQIGVRDAYNYIKRWFLLLDADLCFCATMMDGVDPEDLDDPDLAKILRFSKSGPQKTVRPYEEDRAIVTRGENSDIRRSPVTGELNWVMYLDGPLPPPPPIDKDAKVIGWPSKSEAS